MPKNKKTWWENRVLRSVDNLKLWHDNPRLDPSNKLVTLRDYVEELIADSSDEQHFISLLKSIAERGFMSFDPIVVWQGKDKKFIVAEGNRRVMALKLLRAPERAPISIRKTVAALSRMIDRDEIEKIKVCLAPSHSDAHWYVLQRHSTAGGLVKWQRLQQQRFIIDVYDSVDQDIKKTIEKTNFKKATIVDALRYVKLRDIATRKEITTYLTTSEQEMVYSHKISMTVLERWFGNTQVREAWHIEFDETGLKIKADKNSFYAAYSKLLKLMFSQDNELGFIVNTRTIDSHFQDIFDYLPKVKPLEEGDSTAPYIKPVNSPNKNSTSKNNGDSEPKPKPEPKPSSMKGNPNRPKLTDKFHRITTKSYKINSLFREFNELPVRKYPNVAAASLRVFLELSVDVYISSNDLKSVVAKKETKGYHEINFKNKLNFLHNEFISDREANKVIVQLLNNSNDFSLNTLNEYIHGDKVYKVDPNFLNRFWDMLSPLFFVLIELREI